MAKDSSLRHASIDIYELSDYSINYDPLFSLTQEVKDPVDHTGIYICCFKLVREDVLRNSVDPVDHIAIYICCFKLVREDVMRNSVECFAEVE